MNKDILVLGVGNLLLKDEGVGIHVIQALEKEGLPPNVSLMDGGTGGLHLIGWIQDYNRIIMVDATLDHNPPGTIRLIRPHYEIGLRDMIEAMILTEKLPDIQLIVVSAEDINEVGMDLTPVVQVAVPKVVEMIKQIL